MSAIRRQEIDRNTSRIGRSTRYGSDFISIFISFRKPVRTLLSLLPPTVEQRQQKTCKIAGQCGQGEVFAEIWKKSSTFDGRASPYYCLHIFGLVRRDVKGLWFFFAIAAIVVPMMHGYDYIVLAALLGQMLYLYQAGRNHRYAAGKAGRNRELKTRPRVALVVPCKGLDSDFRANIRSFLHLDYGNYQVFFVVGDASDPAYAELQAIADASTPKPTSHLELGTSHSPIQLLVSGPSTSCSQKIHNLLYAIERLPDDVEIIVFADSDAQVHRDWLTRLVWPLRHENCGVTTGYRWFVPIRNNLPTLVLSALNATVAQLLGNTGFNRAWGGSMAMRLADFRRLGLPEVWKRTLSDDLTVSNAVKKAGMKITFVPGCLVASHEETTWPRLLEFARRQFLITRVYSPLAWGLGLLSSVGSVLGLWGLIALALCAWQANLPKWPAYAAAAGVFFAGQILRAVLRQAVAFRLLPEHASRLKTAAWADIAGCWLWSPLLMALLLSSAFGRTITWRGIRYRLFSPTRTEVMSNGRAETARP
jgi:ceramide glucosyltransferase